MITTYHLSYDSTGTWSGSGGESGPVYLALCESPLWSVLVFAVGAFLSGFMPTWRTGRWLVGVAHRRQRQVMRVDSSVAYATEVWDAAARQSALRSAAEFRSVPDQRLINEAYRKHLQRRRFTVFLVFFAVAQSIATVMTLLGGDYWASFTGGLNMLIIVLILITSKAAFEGGWHSCYLALHQEAGGS